MRNLFANPSYMMWKLNLNAEREDRWNKRQKTQKMAQKAKAREQRNKGAINGGRDREAAEYISGLQVTGISRSRQYPSRLPHSTSLLLTWGEKTLTHSPRVMATSVCIFRTRGAGVGQCVQVGVCVWITCTAICEVTEQLPGTQTNLLHRRVSYLTKIESYLAS